MQAVILAAGQARRLGELGVKQPKCLLKIDGRALIECSIDNLVQGGVGAITIVTGHCNGAIQRHLGPRTLGVPIRYVFNPEYGHTGSVVSLLVGSADIIGSSLLVVESDILYHPDFIASAMTAADNTMMVADASGSGDEVFVCATGDGRLAYLGKAATPALRQGCLGEYAGIARLSATLCRAYREQAQGLRAQKRADGHYEELLFALAQDGLNVRVRHCPSLPWTEVDTVADFDRAKNEIYPRLRHFWEEGQQPVYATA